MLERQHGDMIDSIDLDAATARRFKLTIKIRHALRQRMADLIRSMVANNLEEEEEMWDEIARMFGYKDNEDAQKQGVVFKIDTRKRVVSKHEQL